jgi:2-methylcitrate dehydratase PrpD
MSTPTASADDVDPSVELANFVAGLEYADLPDRAVRLAERCFVDTVGVGLAGATADAGTLVTETLETTGGDGLATLFGRAGGASATDAALANGTAAHALDYDDVSTGMDGHPSPTMVPALLAVAENEGATGPDLLTAYVAGFETQCYLARPNLRNRTGTGLHPRGWHPTAVFGTLGTAAAVARLLDLDGEATRTALNVAASMPAGLRENFGSLTKPLHAGRAAAAGVRAARLAQTGFDATETALEAGFFPTYAGVDDLDTDSLVALGETWSILEEGVDVKLYPSCHATHTIIHAVSTLAEEQGLAPDDVAEIHLEVNEHMAELLVYDDPETEAQAKFSITYTAAAGLVCDYVGIDTFEPETIGSDELQAVRERVTYELDPSVQSKRTVTVRLRTTDGERYTRTADTPPGAHEDPVSDAALREKFMECATRTVEPDAAAALYTTLDSLRDLEGGTLGSRLEGTS